MIRAHKSINTNCISTQHHNNRDVRQKGVGNRGVIFAGPPIYHSSSHSRYSYLGVNPSSANQSWHFWRQITNISVRTLGDFSSWSQVSRLAYTRAFFFFSNRCTTPLSLSSCRSLISCAGAGLSPGGWTFFLFYMRAVGSNPRARVSSFCMGNRGVRRKQPLCNRIWLFIW